MESGRRKVFLRSGMKGQGFKYTGYECKLEQHPCVSTLSSVLCQNTPAASSESSMVPLRRGAEEFMLIVGVSTTCNSIISTQMSNGQISYCVLGWNLAWSVGN